MSNWFKNLKIRYKLLFSFSLTIALLILISAVALFGQFHAQTDVKHVLHTDNYIALLTLQAQRETLKALSEEKNYFLNYEKEGFERAKVKYVTQVKHCIDTIYTYIDKINNIDAHDKEHEERYVQDTTTIRAIEQALNEHKQIFLTLVSLLEKRGFKDIGLEGEFREKVHAIESAIEAPELTPLMTIMLTMRRHEKDYLLRRDEDYVHLFHEEVNHFNNKLKEMNLNPEQQTHLTVLATEYHDAFDKLVQMDADIIAHKEVYQTHNLEPLLQKIHDDALESMALAQTDIEVMANTVMIAIVIVSLIAVIIGVIIAFTLAQSLSKPLTLIVKGAQALTIGDMTLMGINKTRLMDITIRRDEMGEIGRAFVALADYFKEVVGDIVRVSQGLADGNLKVMPQADYRGDFASIKNSLQTSLPVQQRVIEDIMHVSQGLANGELQIKTQGKYRGDFVHIKEALEAALTSLQQVIGDIVRVTKGLAEGSLHVVPQVDYRGDFIQIRGALEIAVQKLADATAQNTAQNWLKNGQAQLNNHMSGEQDFTTLAKNIITFLTVYLDMQVGLFYLLEESNPKKSYLQMVASYAYTPCDNLPTRFAVGEGLIGEAALSRKTVIRTHSPQEYTHIAQSGLTQAVPCHVLIAPFLYEGQVKGVLELGSAEVITEQQQTFLEQVIPNIGIAINTAQSRTRMQVLLQQSQAQAEELQTQQEELQKTNDEIQQRNEELQSQSEELQAQAEELQTQQEELRQANDELERRTRDLESQREEIQRKNKMLEKTQAEMVQAQIALETKAGELEQASRYKSEFLANMSHELRTPLNSLLILAQLLSENKAGNLTEKQVQHVQTIHSAGSELLHLINEILDLSKVEAGHIAVNLEALTFTELVATIEQQFRPVAEEKSLVFHNSIADEIPATIQTDIQRLKQIITNLLANAFKFTEQGEVKLIINKTSEICGKTMEDYVAFHVIDTGIGIPQDKQQIIFDAFQQVDGTTSRRYGGTGLGLSISQQLAKLLGGHISLQSEENKGSTFTFCLPLKDTLTERVLPTQSTEKATFPTIETVISDDRTNLQPEDKFILIIEDDCKFNRILADLAHEKNFKYLLAEEGREGLRLAEEYNPHAIILDIGLPTIDGWTVMNSLKENPETRHIPVHFISASEHSAEAKLLGAIGYLAKPVNMKELTKAFKKIAQFIAKTVKTVLIVGDNPQRTQTILAVVKSEQVDVTIAISKAQAQDEMMKMVYDCLILDAEVEQNTGIEWLDYLHADDTLSQIPLIIYAEKDLTPQQEAIIHRCADSLTVKAVQSLERLLDEVTLFLHQVAAYLPQEKRQMLYLVHNKEAVLSNKKALVVDDDVRNTFALMTLLEDKKMEVLAAYNGKEALKLLEEHPDIDIVLMDIMMPEMDGYEAMRQIRIKPQFRKLPIIALTAKAMKGDKSKCIEAGANDYITKPVDTNKLTSLLRVWLYQ